MSDYLEKKQKNLDKLIRGVSCDNDSLHSDTLLRMTCENAKQYKVSPEDIKEFYELWIFGRVKNIDEFLALCNKDEPTQEDEDTPVGFSPFFLHCPESRFRRAHRRQSNSPWLESRFSALLNDYVAGRPGEKSSNIFSGFIH